MERGLKGSNDIAMRVCAEGGVMLKKEYVCLKSESQSVGETR